jgi:hypothetical protein
LFAEAVGRRNDDETLRHRFERRQEQGPLLFGQVLDDLGTLRDIETLGAIEFYEIEGIAKTEVFWRCFGREGIKYVDGTDAPYAKSYCPASAANVKQ